MATKSPARRKKLSSVKEPVVFMFQPTDYEVVPPERLSEWERLMRDEVGFPPELVKSIAAARLIETICLRNGTPVD